LGQKEKIRGYLENLDRPVSPYTISQSLGLNPNSVRARLGDLVKNGQVQRVAPGLYMIDATLGVGKPPLIQNFCAIVHPRRRLTKPLLEKLVRRGLLQRVGREYHYVYCFSGPPGGGEGLVRLDLGFGVKRNKITWTISAPLGLSYYGFMFAHGLVDSVLESRGWNIRDAPAELEDTDYDSPDFWLVLRGDLLDDKMGVRIEGANCITLYDFKGNLEKIYNKSYGTRKEVHFNEPRPLSENRHVSGVQNATWNSCGKHGGCLYFLAASSCRVDTGYTLSLAADEARSIMFWVKAAPGVSGVVAGFGVSGGSWNRVQFNWSSNKLRLYVRDDAGNVLQYTTVETIADNSWHHIVGVVDPYGDRIQVYVDGELDGGATGTLGAITITVDLTIGCLHNGASYSDYTTAYVDEFRIISRALTDREAYRLATEKALSGASRARAGCLIMLYLGAESESLVYKLFTGRIIDRVTGGDPDEPWLRLVCEDLGEIIHERTWSKEYTTPTQISTIVDDLMDDSVPELYQEKDTTNRAIQNKFNQEGAWNLLEKLANASTFSTGESGANFYVDPGGSLRFKKHGAFTCSHMLSDGSDGETPNILDVEVKETIKGEPRLVNDVRVVVFEAEEMPAGGDAWSESVEGWSSPDPTDALYPQSDTGDKVAGTASIHFNTTNPGSVYRIRYGFPEANLDEFDRVEFRYKYGAGLSPENMDIRLQKGGWTFTTDYRDATGLSIGSSGSWLTKSVNIGDFSKTGNPGATVNNLQIRFYRASGDLGVGGFLVDQLRFIRDEKAGTSSDAGSQSQYGKRCLRLVDKTITDTDYAGYVAGNTVLHRRYPLVSARVLTGGRGQLGYRPPMTVTLTSLKDGVNQKSFQLTRAQHRYTPSEGYTCLLSLIASRSGAGVYEPRVAPMVDDLGVSLAMRMRLLRESGLNDLRNKWI